MPRLRVPKGRRAELRHVAFLLAFLGAAAILVASYKVQTARELEAARAEAAERLALQRRALALEIGQGMPLARLLAVDPAIRALAAGEVETPALRAAARTRLEETGRVAGVAGLFLLDARGGVLAGTGRAAPPVLPGAPAVFGAVNADLGLPELSVVEPVPGTAARLVVLLRLRSLDEAATGPAREVALSTATGATLFSTRRGFAPQGPVALFPGAGSAEDLEGAPASDDRIRLVVPVGRLGLTLVHDVSVSPARAAVRELIAIELMAMAVAVALILLVSARRSRRAYEELLEESDALRRLNARLSAEIDERRRVERELRRAQEGLAQASRLAALGQMSAAISHELSQPLAAMKTYLAGARLLLGRGRGADAEAGLDRTDALVDRMTALTRELKGFARGGEGALRPVDLAEAGRGAVGVLEPQFREAGIALETAWPGEPVIVRADQLRLEQIVINLLRNALDATRGEAGGAVEIRVERRGRDAALTVSDTGPGLPSGARGQLFEPFFTTKAPGEGLGLGLSLSAEIAGHLGGKIAAKPRPGGGARFILALPLAPAPAPRRPARSRDGAESPA